MSYWDTSALVKLYVLEPDSPAFEAHAASQASPTITSRIALYEAQATFRRKETEGVLAAGTTQTTYAELLNDVAANAVQLLELGTVVDQEYGQVLNLCYRQTPPLAIRTLDALHLASARVSGETEIVATDKRLRDAATLLGFALFPV